MILVLKYLQLALIGIFLSLIMGKSFYLRKKEKINTFLVIGRISSIQTITSLSSFILTTLFLFTLIFYLINKDFEAFLSPLYLSILDYVSVKISGLSLVLLGFIIDITALINLGDSWRVGIDANNPGELVTRGVYSISRHPIYIFFYLYFLGTFLINANLIFLIYFLFILVNLYFQAVQEEKFLKEKFGKKYTEYINSTARYIGIKK